MTPAKELTMAPSHKKIRHVGSIAALGLITWAFISAQETPAPPPPRTNPHELLNATLWIQRAAEYRACCWQAYALARVQLDRALTDPNWTAALEQTGAALEGLPPAVILDLDETVLDNSAFEARLIRDGTEFVTNTWDPWVAEASAAAVPGAVEFCRYARERGVTVYYVTNRDERHLADTRRNLERLSLPLVAEQNTILCRTENSDKAPRREFVAKSHRVLLLIGDNNGDFASDYTRKTEPERAAAAERHRKFFGEKWIVLPNPMYGDWDGALIGYDWKQPQEQRLVKKLAALRFQ
ncbi:MAG: 5'-nucleotidase, lipoprotein e(P4) family [Planctomycetota bacterium]